MWAYLDIGSLGVDELEQHLAQLVGVGEVSRGRARRAAGQAARGAAAPRLGWRAAPACHLLRALNHHILSEPSYFSPLIVFIERMDSNLISNTPNF